MQRRKFLIGAGSLAAGAAAVTGTGALSKSDIRRGLSGQIAKDYYTSYVELAPAAGNGQHVEKTGGGQLYLDFGSITSPVNSKNSDGLNANSRNYFDNTFQIQMQDPDQGTSPTDYDIWVTKNVSKNSSMLNFYWGSSESDIITPSNKKHFGSTWNVAVGVMIDLLGTGYDKSNDLEDVFGSNPQFTIHVEKN